MKSKKEWKMLVKQTRKEGRRSKSEYLSLCKEGKA